MSARNGNVGSLVLVAALGFLSACQAKEPIQAEPEPGTANGGAPGTGGTPGTVGKAGGAPGEGGAPVIDGSAERACPSGTTGAPLVRVPAPDGSYYCMDQREVTRSEYAAFLEAKGNDTSGQPKECDWNDRFSPILYDPEEVDYGLPGGYCQKSAWDLEGYPDLPVRCVDFCDAFAYCAWAGKRLCGRRSVKAAGLDTLGDAEVEAMAASTESEWYNACSNGGTTTFPYGDSYEPARCIDRAFATEAKDDLSAFSVTDTSASECSSREPGFSGLYDLSGSVEEWVNICGRDGCGSLGGSFISLEPKLACGKIGTIWLATTEPTPRGIRCCADAVPVPVKP
jgi:formylglycine-generating enzyme